MRCTRCGREYSDTGYRLCPQCRELKRAESRRRYKRLKEAKKCVVFGCNNDALPGRVRCAKCLEIRAREQKARYARKRREYIKRDRARKKLRQEQGLCIICGAPLDDPNYASCINCRTRTKWPQQTFLYYRSTDEDNRKDGTE